MAAKPTHPRQTLPNLQNLNNLPNLPNLRNPVSTGGSADGLPQQTPLAGDSNSSSAGSAGFTPPPRSTVMEYEYHPAVAEMARQIIYSVPIPFDLPEDDRLLFLQAEFNPATLACQFVWTVHDETNQFLVYDAKGWRVVSEGMAPADLVYSMSLAAGSIAINPQHQGFGVLVDMAAQSL